MLRNERSILMAAVGLLAVLNLTLLIQHSGTNAVADDTATDAPALGPAATLELMDASDDDEELVLRNESGRIAWGKAPQHRVWSIGFVHIGPLLSQLMDSEEFKVEREDLAAEAKEREEEFSSQLDQIRADYEDAGEDEAAREEIGRRGQEVFQAFQAFQQEVEMLQQALAADQLERSYRELIAAVNAVADRMDIDIVKRFIPTEDEFQGVDISSAMQEIRLRPALRYPESSDISRDVQEELGLQDE